MKEMISVVMGVYNEPVFLVKQAIDSILKQTYKHLEFIIINDNPRDVDIDNFIKSYGDPRIKYHRNIENLGLAKSLNVGIKIAKGEFIARMDADDISFIDRLEKQLLFLNNNSQIDVVGSAAMIIDEIGAKKGLFKCPITSEQIKVTALLGVPFIHPTVVFRKKVFAEYDFYYNEDYTTAQDFELWSRLVHRMNVANLAEPLLYYRKSEYQISTRKINEQTEFFRKALEQQFKNLNIDFTKKELDLIQLFTRNLDKTAFSIGLVKETGKILEKIYFELGKKKVYDIELLKLSLLKKHIDLLRFYKGNALLFFEQVFNLQKRLKANLLMTIKILLYFIRLKIILKLK
jgi:glycosyltransferase involved in cell wall biosynthesis